MPVRYFCFILLFLSVFTGQAKGRTAEPSTNPYQALEDKFISDKAFNWDSAVYFMELNKHAIAAQKAGDEKLWHLTQFYQCMYYISGKQKNYRLFETGMLKLKERIDKKGIKELQILIRQQLGEFYTKLKVPHNYGLGFDNYQESYQILKSSSIKEVRNKQGLLSNVGMTLYFWADYAEARKILTEALQVPVTNWQVTPFIKSRQGISIVNALGLIYLKEKKYDSAVYYFRKCYRMAEKTQDSTQIGIAATNIGACFFEQHKYREAVPLLELGVRESIKARKTGGAIYNLLNLAKINLYFNDRAKAESQIQQVREMLPGIRNVSNLLVEYYKVQSRLSALKGDHTTAYLFSDSSLALTDSLYARNETLLAQQAKRKLEVEKHQAEMQRLEVQEKQQTTVRYSLIGGIFLLIIIGLQVINQQKIRHRQKQRILEYEKDHIASELEIASRQLGDFTISIREKNKLLEAYAAEIEKLNIRGDETLLQASKEARDKLLASTILTEEQWDAFCVLFDKVHVGYLHRLREKLPNLSQADIRYIALSKLNLNAKEMASMQGVRPDTIRMSRHRLRKKLNIDADKALEELVAAI